MKIIKNLPDLPAERALGVLSGRWKAIILYVLLDGPHRTCELEKRIVGISLHRLVAVEVMPATEVEPAGALTVLVSNRRRVEVQRGFDEETLARLLTVLERL
jgi:hypothetical protein